MAKTLVGIFVSGHILPATVLLIVVVHLMFYLGKRPAIRVEPMVWGVIMLVFLVSLDLARPVLQLKKAYVFGFAVLDLMIAAVCLYILANYHDFWKKARRYPMPDLLPKTTAELKEQKFISTLHIHTNLLLHRDLESILKGLTREIDAGDTERAKEIRRRLQLVTNLGKNSLSEYYSLEMALQHAKRELALEIFARELEIANEELPVIHCYPDLFNWLFTELIRNVLKHNDEDQPSLVIFVEERPYDWMIIFEDNGEGLIPSEIGDIFDLFKLDKKGRIDLSRGMGLALCRKVLRLHHAHMWMETDYYSGVVIYVCVPKHLILNPRIIPEY